VKEANHESAKSASAAWIHPTPHRAQRTQTREEKVRYSATFERVRFFWLIEWKSHARNILEPEPASAKNELLHAAKGITKNKEDRSKRQTPRYGQSR
jgi:hypothetical protein